MRKPETRQTGRGFTRSRQKMPAVVKMALEQTGLAAAYRDRPPCQRND